MIKLKQILKESPDYIADVEHDDEFNWDDDSAYPFYYYKGNLLFSNLSGIPHYDIQNKKDFLDARGISRTNTYDGRVWLDGDLLSFWHYPETKEEMKDISDQLSDELSRLEKRKIDVWNDFRIEVQDDDTDTKDIIPVKNFFKSSNPSAQEYEKHLLSPIAKGNMDASFTGGSKKRPADLTATQRHQIQRTSDGIIKLKTLVESLDKIKQTNTH